MAIIDNIAIITADYPMYRILSINGIDVLLVSPGYIDLKGYSYGFMGGATGNLSEDVVLFSGNFDTHPDKNKIFNFVKNIIKK